MAASQRYRFGPLQRKGMVAGLSPGQVGVLATALLAAVVTLRTAPDPAGVTVAVLLVMLGTAAAFLPVAGRTLEEWAPVVGRWLGGGVVGRRRWVVPVRALGGGGGRPGPAVPPLVSGCRVVAHRLEAMGRLAGVVRDARSGTWGVVLSVDGGGFALLDRQDQERRLASWASVLAGLGREGGGVHRLQWIERSRPGDPGGLQLALAERLVGDAPERAAESYADLLAAAGPVTADHENLLVVTAGPHRPGRPVRATGGGERAVLALLDREVALLQAGLQGAELRCAGPLGPAAAGAALAAGFRAGTVPAERDDDGAARVDPWPVAVEERWDAVRTDGTWHAVYWISEWPRTEVGPDFLVPLLLLSGGARSVSVTMEPVSPRRAAREAEAARTAGAADDELRRRGGFVATARRARQAEAVQRREAELAEGHAEYRFSGYVAVSAPSPDGLERACAEVEQAAGQARLELRRLFGQQADALTWTLPLGRGLG